MRELPNDNNELTTFHISEGPFGSSTAHARSRVALPNGDFAAAVCFRCRAPPFSVARRSRCSSLPAAPGPRDAPLHCLSRCSTARTDHLASSDIRGELQKISISGRRNGSRRRRQHLDPCGSGGGGGSRHRGSRRPPQICRLQCRVRRSPRYGGSYHRRVQVREPPLFKYSFPAEGLAREFMIRS